MVSGRVTARVTSRPAAQQPKAASHSEQASMVLVGIAITGLLAAFMAGVAANVTAFNTVVSYDLWQAYVRKDEPDEYYVGFGRIATVLGIVVAIGTAFIAAGFNSIMDYIQALFSFFNAPLFATFLLAMFWRRATHGGLLGAGLGHLRRGRRPLPPLPRPAGSRLPPGRRLLGSGRGLRGRRGGDGRGQPGHPAQTRPRAPRAGLGPDRDRGHLRRRGPGRTGLVATPNGARR